MTERDPFLLLGLDRSASLDEVRAARRRLAFDRHPDRGGSADDMRDLNAAFDAAVGHLTGRRPLPDPPRKPSPTDPRDRSEQDAGRRPTSRPPRPTRWTSRVQQDVPSFVIDELPAAAFGALLVVASWIGEVIVDDPPCVLEVHLYEPSECWCRLDLVADAGATTISLTVAAVGKSAAPLLDDVRDVWIRHLNQPGVFTE